jgi:protein ImuB
VPADGRGAGGRLLTVNGRGVIDAAPEWLSVADGRPQAVSAWAGPWPVEERWWDSGGRRRARLQVLLEDGTAHLLTLEARRWSVEATYS